MHCVCIAYIYLLLFILLNAMRVPIFIVEPCFSVLSATFFPSILLLILCAVLRSCRSNGRKNAIACLFPSVWFVFCEPFTTSNAGAIFFCVDWALWCSMGVLGHAADTRNDWAAHIILWSATSKIVCAVAVAWHFLMHPTAFMPYIGSIMSIPLSANPTWARAYPSSMPLRCGNTRRT